MLNEVYTEFYSKVVADDIQSQRHYLQVVETERGIPVDYLLRLGCLFIPNSEYIEHYLGEKAHDFRLGFYSHGKCLWDLNLLIPIHDLAQDVVGFVGWDLWNKFKEREDGQEGLSMYKVSPSSVFKRDRFFLSDVPLLKSTFDTRVIFVTDGVFDTLSLSYAGIPSIALLGSSFSREILYFLSWYDRVYVCADNDSAGLSLVRKLARSCSNVFRILQNKGKDIDDVLRNPTTRGFTIEQLTALLTSKIPEDITLRL